MRRTAVTGIGVIAPGGATREAFWKSITSGRAATRLITFFDATGFRSQIAAEAQFDPFAAGLDDQEVSRMDRHVQFAVACALEALSDSGLELSAIDRNRLAVSVGTCAGGVMSLEEHYVTASNRGREWLVNPDYVLPFLAPALFPSTVVSEIALKVSAHGPSMGVTNGSTAGLDAIGHACQLIEDGEADVVLAGGTESPISPIVLAGLDAIKVLSRRNDDPEHASRPFDRDRDGFVLAEGAAVLLLEEMDLAHARGARVYCEIAGFGKRSTGHTMTGLKLDGPELGDAIADATVKAHLDPEQIDYVSAHGSGSRQSDRYETATYKAFLGDHAYKVPISSIKAVVGHALGASGALQAAGSALTIQRAVVPPTANWENPDPACDLDYVATQARDQQINVALITSLGFGGFQSAMILRRPAESSGTR